MEEALVKPSRHSEQPKETTEEECENFQAELAAAIDSVPYFHHEPGTQTSGASACS